MTRDRRPPPPSSSPSPRAVGPDGLRRGEAFQGLGRDGRPRHDGPRHDGPRHDGPRHDGPRHDGPRHGGPHYDGPRHDGARGHRGKPVERLKKPALRIQTTTLWDYPSQHYGEGMQGDSRYVGATPSYIIWNLVQRYTKPGDLVVDPMCGSGTTIDVCKDTGRVGRGFDVNPYRSDIERADARTIPLATDSAKLVFLDPPYGDHIHYSDDPRCIGKLSAYDPRFYEEMGKVIAEITRVLEPGGHFGLYCCDYFEKKQGLACVGFELFALACRDLRPVDVVSVTRHHKTLEQGNYHRAAEEGNFFLRGFNYLFILEKPADAPRPDRRGSSRKR